MDEEFIRFWEDFFQERHWSHRELAKRLHVNDDVISHWANGGQGAISPKHLSELLESGILSHKEASRLIRLRLHKLGFSEASLEHIATALTHTSEIETGQGTAYRGNTFPESPCLLVLSPLAGANPIFYSEILTSLVSRASRSGYRVLIQAVPDVKTKRGLREYYSYLHDLNGVVAITCQVEGSSWLEECKEIGVPIVLVHDTILPEKLQDYGRVSLIWEDLSGLQDLVHHLIRDHGCTNLGIVVANPSGHYHRQRKLNTIIKAAAANDILMNEHKQVYTVSQYSYAHGLQVGKDIIASGDQVDAVICLIDEVALAVLQVAQHAGQQQLIVTGYDDIALADHFDITSVDHQVQTTAERAFFEVEACIVPLTEFPRILSIPTILKCRSSCCRRGLKSKK